MSDTPIYDNTINPAPTFDSIVAKATEESDARKSVQDQIIAQHAQSNIPWWAPFAKAIVGALLSFILAFLSALLPFVVEGQSVSVAGWITASIAGIVALGATFGVVYQTPNVSKN